MCDVQAACEQRRRIERLLGAAADAAAKGAEGAEGAEGLRGVPAADLARWAVAMCSSRPFKMRSPPAASADTAGEGEGEAEGEGGALCAFIPFIDMANHDDAPNCEVQGRAAADGGGYAAVGLAAGRT